MAIIGKFSATKVTNTFEGTIKTLTLDIQVTITPVKKAGVKAPSHRLYVGEIEIGAAWAKTSAETKKDYLSVTFDDPSFPAPVYASLMGSDSGEVLIWNR